MTEIPYPGDRHGERGSVVLARYDILDQEVWPRGTPDGTVEIRRAFWHVLDRERRPVLVPSYLRIEQPDRVLIRIARFRLDPEQIPIRGVREFRKPLPGGGWISHCPDHYRQVATIAESGIPSPYLALELQIENSGRWAHEIRIDPDSSEFQTGDSVLVLARP